MAITRKVIETIISVEHQSFLAGEKSRPWKLGPYVISKSEAGFQVHEGQQGVWEATHFDDAAWWVFDKISK